MNTLRGVFPEPPIIPKRNFIKENMIHIKRMQGFVEDAPVKKAVNLKKADIFSEYTQHNKKTMKLIRNTKKQLDGLNRLSSGQDKSPKFLGNSVDKLNKNLLRKKSIHATECPYYKTAVEAFKESLDKPHRLKEIGTQTEQFYTLKQLYESGTIKYPSQQVFCGVAPVKPEKIKGDKEKVKHKGDGDKRREEKPLEQKTISADMSPDKKHDYVKENAQIVRNSSCKSNQSRNTDPTMAPPTYQKGVIPKYLRERKEELYSQVKSTNNNEKCPDGHVVLPDNERKETLRMLRQSYAELVAELNQLPVRSDTLKIRNRKIEIENQLKKIDEGIKVFTRPKVYVKIGA